MPLFWGPTVFWVHVLFLKHTFKPRPEQKEKKQNKNARKTLIDPRVNIPTEDQKIKSSNTTQTRNVDKLSRE
jgi:hypothetical protein